MIARRIKTPLERLYVWLVFDAWERLGFAFDDVKERMCEIFSGRPR